MAAGDTDRFTIIIFAGHPGITLAAISKERILIDDMTKLHIGPPGGDGSFFESGFLAWWGEGPLHNYTLFPSEQVR